MLTKHKLVVQFFFLNLVLGKVEEHSTTGKRNLQFNLINYFYMLNGDSLGWFSPVTYKRKHEHLSFGLD